MNEFNNIKEQVDKHKQTRRQSILFLLCGLAFGLVLGLVLGLALDHVDHGHEHSALTAHSSQEASKEAKTEIWTCAMHPQIQSSQKGTCPLCGMDLTPVVQEDAKLNSHSLNTQSTVLKLSPRAQKLAQLQSVPVELKLVSEDQESLWGEISVNEKYQSTISAWMNGRIERLLMNKVGQKVSKGQVLAEIYSPEIYQAHQALLSALKHKSQSSILKTTRQRLRLLGISKSQLKLMENAKRPWRKLSIRSQVSGTISQVNIQLGSYIKQGQVLYQLVDLKKLQATLRVNEQVLGQIKVGQEILLSAQSLPGYYFKGQVEVIEPLLNTIGRFALARLTVNPKALSASLESTQKSQSLLLPGMVVFTSSLGSLNYAELSLVIPDSAPLFAGDQSLVYVVKINSEQEYIYEARPVILGKKRGAYYPVLSGLSRGEQVVSRGAFVLDSESQIRGLFSLSTLAKKLIAKTQVKHSEADALSTKSRLQQITLNQAQQHLFNLHLDHYLALQEALAADQANVAQEKAQRWLKELTSIVKKMNTSVPPPIPTDLLLDSKPTDHPDHQWQEMQMLILHDLEPFTTQQTISEYRNIFKHLSNTIKALLTSFGNPSSYTIYEAFCPMAFDHTGGTWLQKSMTIDNVYFGAQMRRCGTIKQEFATQELLLKQ